MGIYYPNYPEYNHYISTTLLFKTGDVSSKKNNYGKTIRLVFTTKNNRMATKIYDYLFSRDINYTINTNFSYKRPSYDKKRYVVLNFDKDNLPFIFETPKTASAQSKLENDLDRFFLKLRGQFRNYK